MQPAPFPPFEQRRQEALLAAALLDTRSEFFFEEALESALNCLQAPMGAISLVDNHRQWFKAQRGTQCDETPRDIAFCAHTILGDAPFLVTDARKDERFLDNPLVTGELGVVAYAGAPIVLESGARIGAVCALDTQSRDWASGEIYHLMKISALVSYYIDLRVQLLKTNRQRYLDLVMSGDWERGAEIDAAA